MFSWPHPYSTIILGVFPLQQIAHVDDDDDDDDERIYFNVA